MPVVAIANTFCYYRLTGADAAPVLILSHSLGQDHGMWDLLVPDLESHFRVLRYDIRGHGASTAPAGEYRLDELGRDVLALADALGIDRFAFCGLSLGGMIGQWLAVHAPARLTSVVLANTSPRPDADRMEARRNAVLAGGMSAVADTVMSRFFSPRLLALDPPPVASSRRTLLATDPVGYAGCCAAIRDFDVVSALPGIHVPSLIIDGTRDTSLPWRGHGEILARDVPDARVVHLDAAHLSNIERPRAFAAALHAFLLASAGTSPRDAGLRVRRTILGDDHVDRAIATAPSLAFQELITSYAWGAIWTRPGLDVRTRRLLVLAMTAAAGRWEEFRMHVRAGAARDLEWPDVEEVLLQVAVYAGMPAANTAFHAAKQEVDAVTKTGD